MEQDIGVAKFADLKEGDLIEAFTTKKMAGDLGALNSTNPQDQKEEKWVLSLW